MHDQSGRAAELASRGNVDEARQIANDMKNARLLNSLVDKSNVYAKERVLEQEI